MIDFILALVVWCGIWVFLQKRVKFAHWIHQKKDEFLIFYNLPTVRLKNAQKEVISPQTTTQDTKPVLGFKQRWVQRFEQRYPKCKWHINYESTNQPVEYQTLSEYCQRVKQIFDKETSIKLTAYKEFFINRLLGFLLLNQVLLNPINESMASPVSRGKKKVFKQLNKLMYWPFIVLKWCRPEVPEAAEQIKSETTYDKNAISLLGCEYHSAMLSDLSQWSKPYIKPDSQYAWRYKLVSLTGLLIIMQTWVLGICVWKKNLDWLYFQNEVINLAQPVGSEKIVFGKYLRLYDQLIAKSCMILVAMALILLWIASNDWQWLTNFNWQYALSEQVFKIQNYWANERGLFLFTLLLIACGFFSISNMSRLLNTNIYEASVSGYVIQLAALCILAALAYGLDSTVALHGLVISEKILSFEPVQNTWMRAVEYIGWMHLACFCCSGFLTHVVGEKNQERKLIIFVPLVFLIFICLKLGFGGSLIKMDAMDTWVLMALLVLFISSQERPTALVLNAIILHGWILMIACYFMIKLPWSFQIDTSWFSWDLWTKKNSINTGLSALVAYYFVMYVIKLRLMLFEDLYGIYSARITKSVEQLQACLVDQRQELYFKSIVEQSMDGQRVQFEKPTSARKHDGISL